MTLKKSDLNNFYGTEKWYRHPLFRKFTYTDGVQYVAEHGGAVWLVTDIFAYQGEEKIKDQPFQVWILKVSEDQTGVLIAEDGNKKKIFRHELHFTDFPLDEITLWFTDNVLMLPTEY